MDGRAMGWGTSHVFPVCQGDREGALSVHNSSNRRPLLSAASLADLMSLQMKFEEDKKKVAEMKAARRFKPYWVGTFEVVFNHCLYWV